MTKKIKLAACALAITVCCGCTGKPGLGVDAPAPGQVDVDGVVLSYHVEEEAGARQLLGDTTWDAVEQEFTRTPDQRFLLVVVESAAKDGKTLPVAEATRELDVRDFVFSLGEEEHPCHTTVRNEGEGLFAWLLLVPAGAEGEVLIGYAG